MVALRLEFSDKLRTPQIERSWARKKHLCDSHPEVVALFVKPQSCSGFGDAFQESGAGGALADRDDFRAKANYPVETDTQSSPYG